MRYGSCGSGLVLAFLVAVCGCLRAQRGVFVVDAAGGPGSSYLDLPAAVAAVPEGSVLLVRPGTYAPFSASGKALTLIGLDRDRVVVGAFLTPLSIRDLPGGKVFVMRSLTLSVPVLSYEVHVERCRGTVLFDDIVALGGAPSSPTPPLFAVDACADVQWHECQLVPPAAPAISATDSTLQLSSTTVQPGSYGFAAVRLLRSDLIAVTGAIRGGDGLVGGLVPLPDNRIGGTGIDADASDVLVLRTPVAGGQGGRYTMSGSTVTYYDGGDGIVLANGSRATFAGSAPAGGGVLAGAVGATPGGASVVGAGSSLGVDAAAQPCSGTTSRPWQLGQTVRYELDAAPGAPAVLVAAYDPALVPIAPLAPGSLLARFVVTFTLPAVPASGHLTVPQQLPLTWPIGETFFGQFATLEPGPNRLWSSNRFPLPAVW